MMVKIELFFFSRERETMSTKSNIRNNYKIWMYGDVYKFRKHTMPILSTGMIHVWHYKTTPLPSAIKYCRNGYVRLVGNDDIFYFFMDGRIK